MTANRIGLLNPEEVYLGRLLELAGERLAQRGDRAWHRRFRARSAGDRSSLPMARPAAAAWERLAAALPLTAPSARAPDRHALPAVPAPSR